jgi:streptogramin lyase
MVTTNKYALTGYAATILDISAGPDGNVWTCAYDDRINKITPAGVVTSFSGPDRSEGICTGPDSLLWITNALTGGISKYTVGGSGTHYSVGTDSYAVCSGPDGNVWYTYGSSSAATHIEAVDTSGVAIRSVALGATNLTSICTGSDSNLWVTDTGGYLWQVTTVGGFMAVALTGHHPGTIRRCLCPGPDGNLWVAAGGIWQVTTGGSATYFAPSGVNANSICPGSDGKLWVADGTHHCVWQVDTSGTVLAQVVLTGSTPNGICPGPDGNIWVLDSAGVAVWQVVIVVPSVGGWHLGSIVWK